MTSPSSEPTANAPDSGPSKDGLQLAVDTGGTFTDIGVRKMDGTLSVWKVPSTPDVPDEAVMSGITGALEQQNKKPEAITRLVHGTTVATNTVLTREGARVGLVTTKDFRDVLAIAHQARPSIYDNDQQRVEPLISDEHIFEINERIDAEGDVVTTLKDADLDELVDHLREQKLDALVVSFLNAYANGDNEQHAVERLRELDVAPIVSAATDITSEMREYDRTSTAAINSYVRPKVSSYMGRLEKSIDELGVPSQLWVMQSNGGLLHPSLARVLIAPEPCFPASLAVWLGLRTGPGIWGWIRS